MVQSNSQFDAVIIGSGATGLSAALTLAEAGANVTVFEKQPSFGGTSFNFRGIFAVESEMQRRKYISYTRDDAFKNIMEFSHWLANPRLVRTIVNQSAETIEWLAKRGVIFTDVVTNIPGAKETYHLVQNSGEDVVKALYANLQKQSVPVELNTPVNRILMKNGAVAGVNITQDGQSVDISSKIVMVATGGYANNKEWIKQYSGLTLDEDLFVVGNEGKMGDGIRMAFEIGAAEEGIKVIETLRTSKDRPGSMSDIAFVVIQPDLWVNDLGERFCDEGVTFDDTSMGNAHVKQRGGVSFSILDSAIVEILMTHGIEKSMALDFPPGSPLSNLAKELEAAPTERPDDVFQADSIAELAIKMGVPKDTFEATVSEYNGFADSGHDPIFAKTRQYMRPIRNPPFYAIKAQTVFLGTMGGIKINHEAEVMGKDDIPIPGLYSGGFDAGGMYGDSYCIRSSTGLSSSFAVNSGRLTGKSALKYMGM